MAVRVTLRRVLRRLREVDASGDLTPSQASALARIAKGDAATASALAALEGVKPQSMANTLAALEAAGLVRREQDSRDGRRQIVTLTEVSSERVAGDRAARQEWLTAAMAEQYSEDERRQIIDALGLLDRIASPEEGELSR